MKTLVINRKRWGFGSEGGSLLNPKTHKMCCLGFACRQAGFSAKDISKLAMPSDLKANEIRPKALPLLSDFISHRKERVSTKVATRLAEVNDSKSQHFQDQKEREKRIKDLFKTINTRVEFVN